MVILKSKKLPAFSLVESLVSLLLISVAFGTALILFNQMAVNSKPKLEAAILVDEVYEKLENEEIPFTSQTIKVNNLNFSIKIKNYLEVNNLFIVNIVAEQNKKELYHFNKLIVHEEF